MLVINEIVFRYVFNNKILLAALINFIDSEAIDLDYLKLLFLEPIGFEKDKLQVDSIIALYENPNGKSILYLLEFKPSKMAMNAIDLINNDYVFLAKYRSILSNTCLSALNMDIKIIYILNYVEYKDMLCIHSLRLYKGTFHMLELPKLTEITDFVFKDFLSCLSLRNLEAYLKRSDIVGQLARAIERENNNPRVIRELKQFEEAKASLTLKYQAGYHKGFKDGFEDGRIEGKDDIISSVVLELNKERISKHRIAKILSISEIEVKGIIDNKKKNSCSLNK